MYVTQTLTAVATVFVFAQQAMGLGINCRGSGLCPLASFENEGNVNVMQGLRDAMYSTDVSDSTLYNDGDHIICVSSSLKVSISAGLSAGYKGVSGSVKIGLSGKIGNGGVCVFPQNTGGKGITLARARQLIDDNLKHGCTTCGSTPVNPGNNVKDGELTINYTGHPSCTDNCLAVGDEANPTAGQTNTTMSLSKRTIRFYS